MTAKESTNTGKNFRGVGGEFSGWPEYIPLNFKEKTSASFGKLNILESAIGAARVELYKFRKAINAAQAEL